MHVLYCLPLCDLLLFCRGAIGSFHILGFTVELSCSTGVSYLKLENSYLKLENSYLKLENSYLKLPEVAKKY